MPSNEEQAKGPASALLPAERTSRRCTLSRCGWRPSEQTDTALLFSSGMAALSAMLLALVKRGDHIVALRQCYGGTHDLLHFGAERFGWSFDLVDAYDPRSWAAAFRPETRDAPRGVADQSDPVRGRSLHAQPSWRTNASALLTVDNTFASPVGQHPLALGADLVMYSATKSIGGHSDLWPARCWEPNPAWRRSGR